MEPLAPPAADRLRIVPGGDRDGLRQALATGIRHGLTGSPLWTLDLDGVADRSPERSLRLLQLAAVAPLVHGEDALLATLQEPWLAPGRAALRLRDRLEPYRRTLVDVAIRRGLPLLRPAWFDAPGTVALHGQEHLALLGDDLLVVAALAPGRASTPAILPPGAWRDLDDGTVHREVAVVPTPLDRLALLVRCTAVLPLADRLRLDLHPDGGELHGDRYDDDPDRPGRFRRLLLRGDGGPGGLHLGILLDGDGVRPPGPQVVEVHGLVDPAWARADGVGVPLAVAADGVATIRLERLPTELVVSA